MVKYIIIQRIIISNPNTILLLKKSYTPIPVFRAIASSIVSKIISIVNELMQINKIIPVSA
uniref:hypothetical protein n=1 Tax=Methanobrevibacter smithii TaxID=2173 RepID=UPI0037DD605B